MLKRSGTLNDYEKAYNLYSRYLKEKQKGKDTSKIEEKLLPFLKSAQETLERIVRVYQSQSDAIKAETKGQDVMENESEAYLTRLKQYLSDTKLMLQDMQEPNTGSNKNEKEGKTKEPAQTRKASMRPPISEIINSASSEIEKTRADTRKKLKDAGYSDKDIKEYMEKGG